MKLTIFAATGGIGRQLLEQAVHAHPTVSESIHEAFEDAHGMVIHGA